jgi:hypothetical protein
MGQQLTEKRVFLLILLTNSRAIRKNQKVKSHEEISLAALSGRLLLRALPRAVKL